MYNTHEEINKIQNLIKKYSERKNKIENANYILAMQLNEIKKGNLLSVEDIAKWDFEMIRIGDSIQSIEDTNDGKRGSCDEYKWG
jgi:hypothetical protein